MKRALAVWIVFWVLGIVAPASATPAVQKAPVATPCADSGKISDAETASQKSISDLFTSLFGFGAVLLLLSVLPEKVTDFAKSAIGLEKRDTLKSLYGWADCSSVLDPAKVPDAAALTAYRELFRAAGENVSRMLWSPGDLRVPSDGLLNPFTPEDLTDPAQAKMVVIRESLIALDVRMSDLEEARVARLRLFSAVVGVVFVSFLRIDAFVLLRHAGLDVAKAQADNPGGGPSCWGMLLTGLGAGMGAPFWQDFLDSLTKAKDRALSKA